MNSFKIIHKTHWKIIILTCFWLLTLVTDSSLAKASHKIDFLIQKAHQGNTQAMCELGLAYYRGEGVLKDPFTAKCWIKKAWEDGSERAGKIWEKLELWKYSGQCHLMLDDTLISKNKSGQIKWIQGIAFVWIPGGCFDMGCHSNAGRCSKDEYPAHNVCLDGFWMGRFEITQEQWESVMGNENPSRFSKGGDYPVEQISFNDAKKFIKKLNRKLGNLEGKEFSLPTEAQWEYVYRNLGKLEAYPFEEETFMPQANCGVCDSGQFHGTTSPVGSFESNSLGIYDMGGNVKEWCQDKYQKNAYQFHEKDNPICSKGNVQVIRGGCFTSSVSDLRCTARSQMIETMKSPEIGLRVVLNLNKR